MHTFIRVGNHRFDTLGEAIAYLNERKVGYVVAESTQPPKKKH